MKKTRNTVWIAVLLLVVGFAAGALVTYLLGRRDILAKPAQECTPEELRQRIDLRYERLKVLCERYGQLASQAPGEPGSLDALDGMEEDFKAHTEPLLYDLYLLEKSDKSFEEWKKDQLLWDGWWEKPPHNPPLRPEGW